jgi:hypothetical protein
MLKLIAMSKHISSIMVLLILQVLLLTSCSDTTVTTTFTQTQTQTITATPNVNTGNIATQIITQTHTVTKIQTTTVISTADILTENAQELYDFATQALTEWDIMKSVDFDVQAILWQALAVDKQGNNTDLEPYSKVINEVEERLKWLYAPSAVLEVKSSLIEQCSLVQGLIEYTESIIYRLNEGNESLANELGQFVGDYLVEELYPLESENEMELINMQLQAQRDLNN